MIKVEKIRKSNREFDALEKELNPKAKAKAKVKAKPNSDDVFLTDDDTIQGKPKVKRVLRNHVM